MIFYIHGITLLHSYIVLWPLPVLVTIYIGIYLKLNPTDKIYNINLTMFIIMFDIETIYMLYYHIFYYIVYLETILDYAYTKICQIFYFRRKNKSKKVEKKK